MAVSSSFLRLIYPEIESLFLIREAGMRDRDSRDRGGQRRMQIYVCSYSISCCINSCAFLLSSLILSYLLLSYIILSPPLFSSLLLSSPLPQSATAYEMLLECDHVWQ